MASTHPMVLVSLRLCKDKAERCGPILPEKASFAEAGNCWKPLQGNKSNTVVVITTLLLFHLQDPQLGCLIPCRQDEQVWGRYAILD